MYLFYIIKNILYNAKLKFKKDKEEGEKDSTENFNDEEGVNKWVILILFNNEDYSLYTSIRNNDDPKVIIMIINNSYSVIK